MVNTMNSKIEKLIKQFAKLPRVGNRAAQRIVLALLQTRDGRAENLAASLLDACENVVPCAVCGCLTDKNANTCEFCRDMSRANGQICVVRDMGDVWTLEKSSVFHGRYHTIGGLISGVSINNDEITITKDLPEDYRELPYGKLRKMFHMVKLDLIDDDTIAPSNSETVYLYYKIG